MSKQRAALPGSHRKAVVGMQKIGPADGSEKTFVTVHVRRKAEPLPIIDHGSHLHPEVLAAEYGASANDFLAIREFAAEYNLEPREESAAKRSIKLFGTVDDLSRAFGTRLDHVSINGTTYRHREGELTVPEDLVGIIQAVVGLDNRPQAKAHFKKVSRENFQPEATAQAFSPLAVAKLYDFPAKLNGSGQIIAIVELDGGFVESDFESYFPGLGLPVPSITAVSVDGGRNLINQHLPDHPELNADGEVALDIEVAGAVAPGAKQLVYFTPNTDQGFLDAVKDATHATPSPTVISISWGSAESNWTLAAMQAMEQAFQDAALLGIPICVAAGDNGSSDGTSSLQADFPASAPHALGCGGTTLIGSGSSISSETVWNDQYGSTGGGVSQVFAKPVYQNSVTVPPPPAGNTGGRGVPDVAGDADPVTGYKVLTKGVDGVVGGTSAVAPLWAGLIARFGQSLGRKVGFLNPLIYQASATAAGFRDVTTGNNDVSGLGEYKASAGWDPCTGLGSPKGAALLKALQGSGLIPMGGGTTHPPHSGTTHPPHSGTTHPPHSGTTHPPHSGTTHPPHSGTTHPPHSGTTHPPHSGTTHPPHSGTTHPHNDTPPFEPQLPPPVAAPMPAAPSSAAGAAPTSSVPSLTSLVGGSSNAVALVGIVGLAAVLGMVTAAGVVATVAMSKDKS